MKYLHKKFSIIFFPFFLLFLGIFFPVNSQNNNSKDEGVTISPIFSSVTLKPGESREIKISLTNHNEGTFQVKAEVKRLGFMSDPSLGHSFKNPDELSDWVILELTEEELKQNETQDFLVQIHPSSDIQPKGYYLACVFSFTPSESSDSTIATQFQLASILYLSVTDKQGNEVKPSLEVVKFGLSRHFSFTPSVSFTTTVKNNGEIFYRPAGRISFIDPNGTSLTSSSLQFNERLIYLLPQQELSQTFSWDALKGTLFPKIGKYKAVLELTIAEDCTQKIQVEDSFFVFPYQYIILGSGIIIALSVCIFAVVRRRKLKVR